MEEPLLAVEPRRRSVCTVISVVINVLLIAILVFILRNNAIDDHHVDPPPPNSTEGQCPFYDNPGASSNDEPQAAITGTGSTYLSICWSNFALETRGEYSAPYRVKVNDYWNYKSIEQVDSVYSGRSLSLNMTNLLPDSKYEMRVASASGRFVAINATTTKQGYCGNSKDVAAYRNTKKTMKTSIQSCMIKHAVSDSAAAECISDTVGLSSECGSCWIQEGHCTLKYCAAACIIPSSKHCAACSEKHCFAECVLCTGMPRWSFPL